jgi:hypothetical protein
MFRAVFLNRQLLWPALRKIHNSAVTKSLEGMLFERGDMESETATHSQHNSRGSLHLKNTAFEQDDLSVGLHVTKLCVQPMDKSTANRNSLPHCQQSSYRDQNGELRSVD